MCIFPSDGIGRIRFTGRSGVSFLSAGCIRLPEDVFALRSENIIANKQKKSSLFQPNQQYRNICRADAGDSAGLTDGNGTDLG